jgi:integrase/recombinase XerD
VLDQDEVRELIRETHAGRDRTLVRFLYLSGCRISEALGLRWIDVGPCAVTVLGKGARVRTVAMPNGILRELRDLRRKGDPDTTWVFRSTRGRRLSARQARHIVAAAAAEALNKSVSPHWLRHAHAAHSIEAGAPLHLIRDSLGHASIATTSKYLGLKPGSGSALYLDGVA